MDAGRFEGLDESAGESERDAILVPGQPAAARLETQNSRLSNRVALHRRHELAGRAVRIEVLAAEHQPIADAMLQRNAPPPARIVGDGSREWRSRADEFRLHGRRAIARQPLRPVVVARLQSLLDEQTPEARAVDEEVPADSLARFENERLDETGFRVLTHLANLALDAGDPI